VVAFALATTLTDAGCIIEEMQFDGALLNANLTGEAVDEVAVMLTGRSVPFAFVTGGRREDLPVAFRDTPILSRRNLSQRKF
jgi:hypothetical protein